MISRVLTLAVDKDNEPVVPNASMVVREADGWYTAYSHRREGQGYAVLAHLFEKEPGTYLVFTDRDQMDTLDPAGKALDLAQTIEAGKTWPVFVDVAQGTLVQATAVKDASIYKPTLPSTIGATNLVDIVAATAVSKTGVQIKTLTVAGKTVVK